jgi:hypothetical protein
MLKGYLIMGLGSKSIDQFKSQVRLLTHVVFSPHLRDMPKKECLAFFFPEV